MARRRGSGITSLRFNQDQGCFSCCLTTGLRIYNVEPLVEKTHYGTDEIGDVLLCEMVGRSNWLFIVRAKQPNTVIFIDDTRRKIAGEVTFKAKVIGIRARNDKLAVVLPTSVQLLSLPSLNRVALLRTPITPIPICDLATAVTPAHQVLIAPAHRNGAVQILDVSSAVGGACLSRTPDVLTCHQGSVRSLSLSQDGAKMCTASNRGTILRVWDTRSKLLLHQLRRGADSANLYCINFNPTSTLVCCVSDKGTIHVWSVSGVRSGKHITTARVKHDINTICAFYNDTNIIAVCEDGTFHKYTFAAEGLCHQEFFEYFLQVGDDDDFIQ